MAIDYDALGAAIADIVADQIGGSLTQPEAAAAIAVVFRSLVPANSIGGLTAELQDHIARIDGTIFGDGPPSQILGELNSVYIDKINFRLYGPKVLESTPGAADGWGPGVVMLGATGATGAKGDKGDQGNPGPQGNPGAPGTNGTNGTNGTDGQDGADGASAYAIAVAAGFVGSEAAWLLSLKGADGADGEDGEDGTNGADGAPGTPGADGAPGSPGADGEDGSDGLSAYAVAVSNGFVGSEPAWLASLKGDKGEAFAIGAQGPISGRASYDAEEPGFSYFAEDEGLLYFRTDPTGWTTGTEFGKGDKGDPGNPGADGAPGSDGAPGQDGADGADGAPGADGPPGAAGNDGAPGPKGDPGDAGKRAPGVYNFNPLSMARAAAALQKVAATDLDATVLFIGDSTTAGGWSGSASSAFTDSRDNAVPAVISELLGRDLRCRIDARGGDEAIGNLANVILSDPTLAFSAGWTLGPGTTAGGFIFTTTTNGATITITPRLPWDRLELIVVRAPAGNAIGALGSVTASDGVTSVVYDAQNGAGGGPASPATVVLTRPGGPSGGSVTLTAGIDAGETLFLPAWRFRDSTRRAVDLVNLGMRASNLGTGSVSPLGWNRVPGVAEYTWVTRHAIQALWAPDLSVINLGINDFRSGGRNPGVAQFKLDYQALIDVCRVSGDVILVVPNDVSDASEGPVDSSAYASGIIDLAIDNGIPWIDLRASLGSYAEALAAGLMQDGLHPTGAGYALAARPISETIRAIAAARPVAAAEVAGLQSLIDAAKPIEVFEYAIDLEATAMTTGTAKITVRMPYAFTLTAVRASLSTASTSGIPQFDIKENGVSILSTKLTIDANEKSSTTAATPAVISDASLADDAEITFDVIAAGTGAKGAKIKLIGRRA